MSLVVIMAFNGRIDSYLVGRYDFFLTSSL